MLVSFKWRFQMIRFLYVLLIATKLVVIKKILGLH